MFKGIKKDKSKRPLSFSLSLDYEKNIYFKFKDGDREIFSKAYENYRGHILSYLMGKLGNSDVAEELMQEVFLKAFRFCSSFDPQFAFSTWIKTIARNTLSDWFRKNSYGFSLEEGVTALSLENFPSLNPSPESNIIEAGDYRVLMSLLDSLTDLQKRVLYLRMVNRLAYQEIAVQLSLSLSAVKSILFRARSTLVDQLTVQSKNEVECINKAFQ